MIEIKSNNTKLLDKEAFEANIRKCNELCFQGQLIYSLKTVQRLDRNDSIISNGVFMQILIMMEIYNH
jgi:hypothetical protein